MIFWEEFETWDCENDTNEVWVEEWMTDQDE